MYSFAFFGFKKCRMNIGRETKIGLVFILFNMDLEVYYLVLVMHQSHIRSSV